MIDDDRATTLEKLHAYVLVAHEETPRRKRSKVEPAWNLTASYVDWFFAYAHARIENVDRSVALRDTAPGRLAAAASDPVHVFLTAACRARVDEALGDNSLFPSTSDSWDRVTRYKIDRLLEESWILGRGARGDAMARFASRSSREPTVLRQSLDEVRADLDVDPAKFAEQIHADDEEAFAALLVLIRTWARTSPDKLAAVWTRLGPAALAPESRAAYAAGLIALADERASKFREQLDRDVSSASPMTIGPLRIAQTPALALGFAHLPISERCAAIENLAQGFEHITDSSATSSHYSVSVLAFVDSLVVGLVE